MKITDLIWAFGPPLIIGGIAVGACVGLVHYQKLDSQHRACVAAVEAGPAGLLSVEALCAPKIAAAQEAALMSAACDLAVDATPENTFALRQTCSSAVKTVVAERDVARGERDGAKADLKAARDGQAAAITRAETRVRSETQRKADAAAALSRAPRDADGLVVCDADCLRQRAGG